MIEKYRLNQIADILSGYSFRMSVAKMPQGKTLVIQSQDLLPNSINFDLESLQKVNTDDLETLAFLKKGDVLVASKGNSTVGYFDENLDAIATSSILVVRVNNKKLIPKYLAIYLSSPEGQKELEKISIGAYIKGISKSQLERLNIPVPDIEYQKRIISLYDNIVKQKDLLDRKKDINENILNYAVKKLNF